MDKKQVLDILTEIWLLSPAFLILDLSVMIIYPTIGLILGIILVIFVFSWPFILGKIKND